MVISGSRGDRGFPRTVPGANAAQTGGAGGSKGGFDGRSTVGRRSVDGSRGGERARCCRRRAYGFPAKSGRLAGETTAEGCGRLRGAGQLREDLQFEFELRLFPTPQGGVFVESLLSMDDWRRLSLPVTTTVAPCHLGLLRRTRWSKSAGPVPFIDKYLSMWAKVVHGRSASNVGRGRFPRFGPGPKRHLQGTRRRTVSPAVVEPR